MPRGDPLGLPRRRLERGRLLRVRRPGRRGHGRAGRLHWIQGNVAPDLAVRWNCKAAKCGSCSAEVDGRPRLMCKTRLPDFDRGADHRRADARLPAHPRPRHGRLLELRGQQDDSARSRPPTDVPQEDWRWQQEDIERVQEFRKCIECFLCQDVCHVLRNHETERRFIGPRYLVRAAGLEMHPIDQADRRDYLKDERGHRLLQHHQVLHRGLPGAHHDHRQRDHPAQGARRRRVLRPAEDALAQAAR